MLVTLRRSEGLPAPVPRKYKYNTYSPLGFESGVVLAQG